MQTNTPDWQTKDVSTVATTNESGNYDVTDLIPDVYKISVEGTGFKTLDSQASRFPRTPKLNVDYGLRWEVHFPEYFEFALKLIF